MILLTEEEIGKLSPEYEGGYISGVYYYYNDGIRDGAKAQLRKVAEWGDKPCEHGVQQKRCVPCWQSLLKEIE